jgi:hypothetical protein
MSYLKPGTLCVIVGGCPKNIGLIVEVLAHIEPYSFSFDKYSIRTVSGRPFPQLWNEKGIPISSGNSNQCYTDRHKLRPLVDPKNESKEDETDVEDVRSQKRELSECFPNRE